MNMKDTRDYTLSYALLPFCYWGAFCSISSYASFYLLSIGFRNTTIGTIIAIAAAFSAIFQPIVAGYADKPESMSLKTLVLLITGLQLAGYAVMFAVHQKSMVCSGLIYGIQIALHQLLMPLINSLGTETLNQGKKLNYGAARALGSLGYAVVAFLLGIITAKTESVSVLLCALLLLFMTEFFLFLFPFKKQKRHVDTVIDKGVGGFAFFGRYRRFTVVLVGCILIYISHVFINNFTLQIVQVKGGGPAEMGISQALASVLELPIMFLFGWMMRKASCRTWFRISGMFFFLKCFFTLLAPNMMVMYAVQSLQMFGWALISVSSVYYINGIMKDADKIKGQAYFTMTYTLGSVFGSFLGGTLLDMFSANVMVGVGSVCGFAGALIMFFAA